MNGKLSKSKKKIRTLQYVRVCLLGDHFRTFEVANIINNKLLL